MPFHGFESRTGKGRNRNDQTLNQYYRNKRSLQFHFVAPLSSFLISPNTYLAIRSSMSRGEDVSLIVPPGFRISPLPPGSIFTNLSPMRPEVLTDAIASS